MTAHEFKLRQDALLEDVPMHFRGWISYYAWEQGHSAGYEEVLIYITELVDGIKECLKNEKS
jgi:hypothetical protein